MSRNTLKNDVMAGTPGYGQLRKSGARGDRFMEVVALHDSAGTLRDLAQSYKDSTGVDTERDAVRKGLAMSVIFQRIAKRKPVLSRLLKADRLRWSCDHAHLTEDKTVTLFHGLRKVSSQYLVTESDA